LHGASEVDVSGTLYDVEFRSGSCIELFGGCESLSDFPFSTDLLGDAATQALLDQVMLDSALGQFDSNPSLTNGCSSDPVGSCLILTPFEFRDPVGLIMKAANNRIDGLSDTILSIGSNAFEPGTVLGDPSGENLTYAVWTPSPQPVPGPGLFLGIGLLVAGMSALRK